MPKNSSATSARGGRRALPDIAAGPKGSAGVFENYLTYLSTEEGRTDPYLCATRLLGRPGHFKDFSVITPVGAQLTVSCISKDVAKSAKRAFSLCSGTASTMYPMALISMPQTGSSVKKGEVLALLTNSQTEQLAALGLKVVSPSASAVDDIFLAEDEEPPVNIDEI